MNKQLEKILNYTFLKSGGGTGSKLSSSSKSSLVSLSLSANGIVSSFISTDLRFDIDN